MSNKFCLQTALLIALSGCSVGPKYEPPFVLMPCEWHSEKTEGMQSCGSDSYLWWEWLNDPMLTSLIERTALQNLDLSIASARIQESRAQLKGGSAALLPHLDSTANYDHGRFNKHTLNRTLGTDAKRNNFNFYEAGFDAEWELDLFGKTAHDIGALKATSEASELEYSHLWVTLSAEVARNYIALRGLQVRLKAITNEIETQKDSLRLTKDLATTGFSSSIDELQANALLSLLAAQRPEIVLAINKTIHSLSVLLGYAPGVLFEELNCSGAIPMLPCQKPIGIPSELLRRRPDIQKAERALAAATESVGSAVAALFPRLSLRGFIGDLGALGPGSFTWFVGPQLLAPIFNSRSLKQDVAINKAKAQQALHGYEKTVLQALEEAENAIASLHAEQEKNGHLKDALEANKVIYEQTMELYQKGFKSYIEVIAAGRNHFDTHDAYLQSQTAQLLHFISLYKALGGGWQRT